MARTRLRIGERGSITTLKKGDKKWQARCYYRDSRGARKELSAMAATKAAAVNALKDKWHHVSSKIITRHDGPDHLTLDQLAEDYFAHLRTIRSASQVNTETLPSRYKQYVNHIRPRIGQALVAECSSGMLSEVLQGIIRPDGGLQAVADKCRSILMGMFDYAASFDIVNHNPARNVPSLEYRAPQPKVWSDRAIYNIRLALHHWESTPPHNTTPVADIFDMTLATGCRISEVLGMMWEDLYLPDEDNQLGSVYIHQAVVRRTTAANYIGATKTQRNKKLSLPTFAVETLKRRKATTGGKGLVFANTQGNPFNRGNIARTAQRAFKQARQELGIDLPDTLPFHTSRRTVLTEVAETYGLEAASRQGGHSSLRVTERHYVLRDEHKVIDFAGALERFGQTGH